MPCVTDPSDLYDGQMKAITELTQHLCSAMKVIEEKSLRHLVSVHAVAWWDQHKIWDAKRCAEEKVKSIRQQAHMEAEAFRQRRLKELGVE